MKKPAIKSTLASKRDQSSSYKTLFDFHKKAENKRKRTNFHIHSGDKRSVPNKMTIFGTERPCSTVHGKL